jgi:hypothetical protein
MNSQIKSMAVLAGIIISGMLCGQQSIQKRFPAQLTFVYPVGIFGYGSVNYCYNVSINALTGHTGSINGIEAGGLLNMNKGSVSGFQAGGIGNITNGDITGVQAGGIFSISANTKGMQIGGIFCKAAAVKGIQISGIASHSDSSNVMISGISNINSGSLKGVQIGGIFNYTQKLIGLQIGLINISDTIEKGIPVGLISITRKGFYDEWSVSVSDYMNMGISYKAGSKFLYNIYSIGVNFINEDLWVTGFGFGHIENINVSYQFRPELVCYAYFPRDFKHIRETYTAHLKFGFVSQLSDVVSVSLSPSLYWALKTNEGKYKSYGYEQSPFYPVFETRPRHSNSLLESGFGCSLELNFR